MRPASRRAWRWPVAAAASLAPGVASAAFLQGEALDSMAMGIAWFVIIVMPIAAIVLFWKLHVLPEKIAEKRHHPQKDAIHVLCLLSLAFGGLLWPIAWLWAYTRPTTTLMAYGTEKHEDYFHEMGAKWRAGELTEEEIEELRDELDAIAAKTRLPRRLKALRKAIDGGGAAPGPDDAPPAPIASATPAGGAA